MADDSPKKIGHGFFTQLEYQPLKDGDPDAEFLASEIATDLDPARALDAMQTEANNFLIKNGHISEGATWEEILFAKFKPSSVEWFAREILIHAHSALLHIENNRAAMAVFSALRAAEMRTLVAVNVRLPRATLSGAKIIYNGAGDQRSPEEKQKKAQELSEEEGLAFEYWSRKPNASNTEVGKFIARKTGKSFNTIRQRKFMKDRIKNT